MRQTIVGQDACLRSRACEVGRARCNRGAGNFGLLTLGRNGGNVSVADILYRDLLVFGKPGADAPAHDELDRYGPGDHVYHKRHDDNCAYPRRVDPCDAEQKNDHRQANEQDSEHAHQAAKKEGPTQTPVVAVPRAE